MKHLYAEPIAYSVVKVEGSPGDGGRDRLPTRRGKPPRPYEHPVSASPPLSSADVRPKRGPTYEEIDIVEPLSVDGE